MATGATPGSGLPFWWLKEARSPMTKISGWPGTLRSSSTMTRPGAIERRPGALGEHLARGAGAHAGGPEHGVGGNAVFAAVDREGDSIGVDGGNSPRWKGCATAEPRFKNCRSAFTDRSGGKVGAGRCRFALHQDDGGHREGRCGGKSWRLGCPRATSPSRAGEFDAGGPAADDDEIQQARRSPVRLALGTLEGVEERLRISVAFSIGFQAGRDGFPLRITE